MIPKVLHRIVLPPLTSSGSVQVYWDGFARLHRSWRLQTWEGPVRAEEWELGALFGGCSTPAGIADLMRLEILWRHGGIYVDTDCEPVRALDPLLHHSCFLGTEDGWHITTSVIGCEPKHPAIRAYMDAIVSEDRPSLGVTPNEATGPILATEILGGRDDVTVLPPEFFYPRPYASLGSDSQFEKSQASTPFTYVVHQWAHSWAAAPVAKHNDGVRARLKAGGRSHAVRLARAVKRRWDGLSPEEPPGTYGCYLGGDRVCVQLPDGSPLIAVASDLSLTPELVAKGCYDRPFWAFLERVLRPGDHVVDVGANIGLFSVRMAHLVGPLGRVHAFEPDPYLAEIVADNLQTNWVNQRVTIHRLAATSSSADLVFHRHTKLRALSAATSASEGPRSDVAGVVESFDVAGERLDAILTTDIPIRLVKVDVEGGEADVLEGMTRLLDAGVIRLLDVEVIRADAPASWTRLAAWLRRLTSQYGATIHLIADDGRLNPVTLDHVLANAGHFPHVVFDLTGELPASVLMPRPESSTEEAV